MCIKFFFFNSVFFFFFCEGIEYSLEFHAQENLTIWTELVAGSMKTDSLASSDRRMKGRNSKKKQSFLFHSVGICELCCYCRCCCCRRRRRCCRCCRCCLCVQRESVCVCAWRSLSHADTAICHIELSIVLRAPSSLSRFLSLPVLYIVHARAFSLILSHLRFHTFRLISRLRLQFQHCVYMGFVLSVHGTAIVQ